MFNYKFSITKQCDVAEYPKNHKFHGLGMSIDVRISVKQKRKKMKRSIRDFDI